MFNDQRQKHHVSKERFEDPAMKLFAIAVVLAAAALVMASAEADRCPLGCSCHRHKSLTDPLPPDANPLLVDCFRSGLTFIPAAADMPPDAAILNMAANNLRNFTILDTMPNLRELNLESANISIIHDDSFVNAPGLESLFLSYNKIKTLPDAIFVTLIQLKHLNLSHNHFEYFPERAFANNNLLETLRLGNNPIKTLPTKLFDGLLWLKELDLSDMKLYHLEPTHFASNPRLEVLDISKNEFNEVPTSALRAPQNGLKKLILDDNPIKILDEKSFVGLESLEELYIRNMPSLLEIRANTFSHLRNLRVLRIENNRNLHTINRHAFRGISYADNFMLKEVSLYGNMLTTLSAAALPWEKVEYLDLRHNPWDCDCTLQWIKFAPLRPELTHGLR